MVTGSLPPDACGVGDYTYRLCSELKKTINLQILHLKPSLKGIWQSYLKIRKPKKEVIIHMQYPTLGFGKNLWPLVFFFIVSLHGRTILTAHEYKRVATLRKLVIAFLCLFADQVIFTNRDDLNGISRSMRWIKKKSMIIPIGSSFVKYANKPKIQGTVNILFFGIIRPNRGLEQFLACARECHMLTLGRFEFHVLGHCLPTHKQYLEQLKKDVQPCPISWHISYSEQEVSLLLSQMQVAYLPIPGGVTDRNSSVQACLQAGLHILAPAGEGTSLSLRSIIIVADDSHAATQILSTSIDKWSWTPESLNRSSYLRDRDWGVISEQHERLYHLVHST